MPASESQENISPIEKINQLIPILADSRFDVQIFARGGGKEFFDGRVEIDMHAKLRQCLGRFNAKKNLDGKRNIEINEQTIPKKQQVSLKTQVSLKDKVIRFFKRKNIENLETGTVSVNVANYTQDDDAFDLCQLFSYFRDNIKSKKYMKDSKFDKYIFEVEELLRKMLTDEEKEILDENKELLKLRKEMIKFTFPLLKMTLENILREHPLENLKNELFYMSPKITGEAKELMIIKNNQAMVAKVINHLDKKVIPKFISDSNDYLWAPFAFNAPVSDLNFENNTIVGGSNKEKSKTLFHSTDPASLLNEWKTLYSEFAKLIQPLPKEKLEPNGEDKVKQLKANNEALNQCLKVDLINLSKKAIELNNTSLDLWKEQQSVKEKTKEKIDLLKKRRDILFFIEKINPHNKKLGRSTSILNTINDMEKYSRTGIFRSQQRKAMGLKIVCSLDSININTKNEDVQTVLHNAITLLKTELITVQQEDKNRNWFSKFVHKEDESELSAKLKKNIVILEQEKERLAKVPTM